MKSLSDETQIRGIIDGINAAWLCGRANEIAPHFVEDAVLVMPGFGSRVEGRAALVQSYLDFTTSATIHEFAPAEPVVDVFLHTATALCPFRIVYQPIGGAVSRERGHDLFVFSRVDVVWRTVSFTVET